MRGRGQWRPGLLLGGSMTRRSAMVLVLVIAACCAFAAELARANEVEFGIDRPGADYKDFTMQPSIAGFGPCQSTCESDAKCKAWTFVQSGVQGNLAHCWLKSSVPNPVPNKCCVSGVPVRGNAGEGSPPKPIPGFNSPFADGVNLMGRDYKKSTASGAQECQAICAGVEEQRLDGPICNAWTYVKQTHECWLKGSVPPATRDPCCTSGILP